MRQERSEFAEGKKLRTCRKKQATTRSLLDENWTSTTTDVSVIHTLLLLQPDAAALFRDQPYTKG